MARLCLGMNDKTSQGWLASCSRDVYVPVGDEGWATTVLWVATVGQPEDKSSGYQMEEPMARLCLGMNDKTSQGWLTSCSRDVYVPVGGVD
jgi:hypothetical protein